MREVDKQIELEIDKKIEIEMAQNRSAEKRKSGKISGL